jgi:stringent starvation protein B
VPPQKPLLPPNIGYLIRAVYEWLADNNQVIYLMADAAYPGLDVPVSAIKEGRVVLNITGGAVANLVLGNEAISFSARFSGREYHIMIPILSVMSIYSRETHDGMAFAHAQNMMAAEPAVKLHPVTQEERDVLNNVIVPTAEEEVAQNNKPEPPSPPKAPAGRGHLRVVK